MRNRLKIYFAIIFLFFLHLSGCKKNERLDTTTTGDKIFQLDSLKKESISIHHLSIRDENKKEYDLVVLYDKAHWDTKLFLIKNNLCVDSFLLNRNSPLLVKAELLKSRNKAHFVYELQSSGCTNYFEQAIVQIMKGKIFTPLVFDYQWFENCSFGISSTEPVDSSSKSYKLDLELLDSFNLCKFEVFKYKQSNFENGKVDIAEEKSVYTIPFNSSRKVYCDTLKYLNFEYLDCTKKRKRLKGIYPIAQEKKDWDGGQYIEIFIDREWYVFFRGILSPYSNRCF